MRKDKAEKSTTLILNAIPERLVEWEKDKDTGLAILLVPRFRKGPLKKWLQPKLKRPYMKIKLDDVGTCVWENCDGKKTVKDIGVVLSEVFGDRVNPIDDRLKLFFSSLYRSKFVKYWQVSK